MEHIVDFIIQLFIEGIFWTGSEELENPEGHKNMPKVLRNFLVVAFLLVLLAIILGLAGFGIWLIGKSSIPVGVFVMVIDIAFIIGFGVKIRKAYSKRRNCA